MVLWDIESNKEIHHFQHSQSGLIFKVALSQDRKLALGVWAGGAALWNLETGGEFRQWNWHQLAGQNAAFLPDRKTILAGNTICDIETGAELLRFWASTDPAALSSDGKFLLTVENHYTGTAVLLNLATGQKVCRLQGKPSNAVDIVRFSLDGKYALGGAENGKMILWEAATGNEVRRFDGPSGAITDIAFSPNGKQVLTVIFDEEAFLWNIESGRIIRSFSSEHLADNLRHPTFSPDGRYLLTTDSGYGDSLLWDINSGQMIHRFVGTPSEYAPAALFSPSGKFVIVQNGRFDDLSIQLFSLQNFQETHRFSLSNPLISFSSDDKYVLIFDKDRMAVRFEIQTGRQGARIPAEFAVLSPNGDYILNSRLLNIELHNAVTGNIIWQTKSSSEKLKFSPDGKNFLVIGDGNATLWSVERGKLLHTFEWNPKGGLDTLEFSSDSRLLMLSGEPVTAVLWEVNTGKQLHRFRWLNSDWLSALDYSSSQRQLLLLRQDGTLVLWGRRIKLVSSQRRIVAGVGPTFSYSCGGKFLAIIGVEDGKLALLDTETGEETARLAGISGDVSAAGFSSDCRYVLVGDDGGSSLIWDIAKGQETARFESLRDLRSSGIGVSQRPVGRISSVSFTADNGTVIALFEDGSIESWDISRKKGTFLPGPSLVFQEKTFAVSLQGFALAEGAYGSSFPYNWRHPSRIALDWYPYKMASALSPDGEFMLGGGEAGAAALWNLKTETKSYNLPGHTGAVTAVAFSADGKFLLTGGVDSTARVWDRASGAQRLTLISNGDRNWRVVAPDGRFDISSFDDLGGLHWVVAFPPILKSLPIEIFMRDYYEPQLLTRVLKGEEFPLLPSIAELNQAQPTIERIDVKHKSDKADVVDVTVRVASVKGQCLRGDRYVECESGVYDLRLYRDGQLVKQSPVPDGTVDNLGGPNWRQQLQKWQQASLVKNEDGKPITVASGPQEIRFTNIELPKRSGVSQVEFTAYAFNEDRVKSATSEPKVYPLPQPRPGVQPKAYVVTVGVDFTSARWRLGFARKGVAEIEALLQENLKSQYKVVPVQLLSAYQKNSDQLVNLATRKNIQTVLNILSGRDVAPADRAKIPHQEQLQTATPDDLVILYIASHGYVDPAGKFYVIPSDIGPPLGVSEESLDRCLKNSELSSICEAGRRLLEHSISSDELTQWIGAIDAGQMALILDSCHSGAVTGPNFKPGPMGDRSFGQLSYDKAMLVLAAAQAEQLDTGTLALNNRSLLTYALTQKASGPIINLRNWLSAAEKEVPNLYRQFVKSDSAATLINDSDQEPSLFDFSRHRSSRLPNN